MKVKVKKVSPTSKMFFRITNGTDVIFCLLSSVFYLLSSYRWVGVPNERSQLAEQQHNGAPQAGDVVHALHAWVVEGHGNHVRDVGVAGRGPVK